MWKNRRESGLVHDQMAPRDPFFSAPCGTAGGPDDRAIDAPQFVLVVDVCRPQLTKHVIQSPIVVPMIEQSPTACQGPNSSGKSRQGAPVRRIHKIPSTIICRSLGGRPVAAGSGKKSREP